MGIQINQKSSNKEYSRIGKIPFTFHFFERKKIGDKSKQKLYSELGTLINSGIDLGGAINLIISGTHNKSELQVLRLLSKRLIQGSSLSSGMKEYNVFSEFEIYSIKIGEESGMLAKVFKNLAFHFNHKLRLRRQLSTIFAYPIFVTIISTGVLYFLFRFIVPMFSSVFERFEKEMPPLTNFVINLSNWLGQYGLLLILILIVGILTLIKFKENEKVKSQLGNLQLRVPYLGDLIKKIYLAQFCVSMEMLITASVPLNRAINLCGKMIKFYPLSIALNVIEKDVVNGATLNDSMKKFPFFDPGIIILTKVGEEVNSLDETFGNLSNQFIEEIDHKTKILSSILEPFVIFVISAMVGVVLIAMYLPLFKLSTTIG